MADEIRNARIAHTHLGFNDRGLFTLGLDLSGDGWGVWWGVDYALDDKPLVRGEPRRQTELPAVLMAALFQALGVDTWEALPGTYVRAKTTGLGGRVTTIGHLLKDQWVDIEAVMASYIKRAEGK